MTIPDAFHAAQKELWIWDWTHINGRVCVGGIDTQRKSRFAFFLSVYFLCILSVKGIFFAKITEEDHEEK